MFLYIVWSHERKSPSKSARWQTFVNDKLESATPGVYEASMKRMRISACQHLEGTRSWGHDAPREPLPEFRVSWRSGFERLTTTAMLQIFSFWFSSCVVEKGLAMVSTGIHKPRTWFILGQQWLVIPGIPILADGVSILLMVIVYLLFAKSPMVHCYSLNPIFLLVMMKSGRVAWDLCPGEWVAHTSSCLMFQLFCKLIFGGNKLVIIFCILISVTSLFGGYIRYKLNFQFMDTYADSCWFLAPSHYKVLPPLTITCHWYEPWYALINDYQPIKLFLASPSHYRLYIL